MLEGCRASPNANDRRCHGHVSSEHRYGLCKVEQTVVPMSSSVMDTSIARSHGLRTSAHDWQSHRHAYSEETVDRAEQAIEEADKEVHEQTHEDAALEEVVVSEAQRRHQSNTPSR